MQIIIFEIGQEKYAIDTLKVQGIDKIMDITLVPCAPKHIKGLVNLRGNIISVYDPYVILNAAREQENFENILIIETDDEQLGIIVDKVVEVVDMDVSMVKNIAVSREDDKEYIKGTINMGDSIVTLIDIDNMLKAA
jgi:purine-binding chemotaxis protein CheW